MSNQDELRGLAVGSCHIYWADQGSGTIMEANLDGTGVTTLVSGLTAPFGVAVDSSHIYWAEPSAEAIMEANLDGTGATAIATDPNFPQGVAVGPQ